MLRLSVIVYFENQIHGSKKVFADLESFIRNREFKENYCGDCTTDNNHNSSTESEIFHSRVTELYPVAKLLFYFKKGELKLKLYFKFKISFEEALEYRKSTGAHLRPNQWQDLTCEVYI